MNSFFTFDAPIMGGAALIVVLGTIAAATLRRPAVPAACLALAGGGAVLLAVAAGDVAWLARQARPVVVMVDLSPSTRAAGYRDPAALGRRVRELLGETPREIRYFADGAGSADPASGLLPDLPARRTVLPEVDAPAVLLFGDGRFASPAALPPTYCVIDGALDDADDAAVTALDARGDSVTASVRNRGAERLLVLRGMTGPTTVPTAPGVFSLARRALPDTPSLSAGFAPRDAWPENDSLRALPPPAPVSQRWWVGRSDPGDAWTFFTPENLPADPAPFLSASVVVLDNVPADALVPAGHNALRRYVDELGGGLVILGGDRAFVAGGYAGTALEALSPLASTPPEPTTHWILLADASGSMNQDAGDGVAGRTRWQYAAQALTALPRHLPPADLLSIGSFAQDLRWWSQSRSVQETRALALPPDDVRPRGPTHLDAVLRQIAAGADAGMPKQFLLATDGNAEIAGAADLAAQLKSRQLRLHVLLIGEPNAAGRPALESVAAATGGTLRVEQLPQNWAQGLHELMRAARPSAVQRGRIDVTFTGAARRGGAVTAALWNRTWPRAGVEQLAEAKPGGKHVAMAARWNVGAGRVAAAAFPVPAGRVEPLAALVARPPRDPRFNVSWVTAGAIRVTVEAADGAQPLNGQSLSLETRAGTAGGTANAYDIPQVAPGRYQLAIEPPRQSLIATVRRGQRVLDTIAVAERYAPEFEAIGNDRAALAELARRTGGAVIEPGVTRPLALTWPRRPVSLVSFCSTGGAVLVAAGLVRWRIGS